MRIKKMNDEFVDGYSYDCTENKPTFSSEFKYGAEYAFAIYIVVVVMFYYCWELAIN